MSFFTEFRPLFQTLDDPFFSGFSTRNNQRFADASVLPLRQPAVHLAEDTDHYVVEAEVPGVKRENLSLTVGEDGKSLVIEGKAEERNPRATARIENVDDTNTDGAASPSESKEMAKTRDTRKSIGGEHFLRNMSFSRTILLPRPVNSEAISAKLDHGVLRVELPKTKEHGRVKVNIN